MSPIIPYLLATLCGIVMYGLFDEPLQYVDTITFASLGLSLLLLLVVRHKAPLVCQRWVTIPMLFLTALFAYNQTALNVNGQQPTSDEIETDFSATIRSSADYCVETLSSLGIKERNLSLVRAILLGDKSGLTPDQRNAFRRTGTMHILVVSGMHVALVFLVFRFLFAFIGLSNSKLSNITIVSIIWLYAIMTGLAPSVCRASLMLSFASLLPLFWSRIDSHDAIYLSLIVILLHNPTLISSYSLWLSYMSVYAISQSTWLLVKIDGLLTNNKNFFMRIMSKSTKWMAQLFLVSCICQLATSPIILSFNDSFPTFFWINNVVIVPLLTPLIILSSCCILIAPVSATIANLLAQWTDNLLSLMDSYTQYAQHWHQTTILFSGYTVIEIIILCTIMVLLFTLIGQWRSKNRTLCEYLLCLSCISFFASNLILPLIQTETSHNAVLWRRYNNVNVSLVHNRNIIHLLADTTDDSSLNECIRLNREYHALSSSTIQRPSSFYISTLSDTIHITPHGVAYHNNEIVIIQSLNRRKVNIPLSQ